MSINPENQTLEPQTLDPNPNQSNQAAQQWETTARAWLSSLPEGKSVTVSDVEAWINSNHASLSDEVKSMSLQELYERIASIQRSMELPHEEKDASQVDPHHARFQRTDQWMPVYSWLESLDTDEVVKSQDILDWLTENPEIREQLYVRHSRYHLMHYIKKCHGKMLKRKEKKRGFQPTKAPNSVLVQRTEGTNRPAPLPCTALTNLPKDSDLYAAKRSEALHKYEILLELEKELSILFPKRKNNDHRKL